MSPFFVACAFAFWLLFIWVLNVFVDLRWDYGHWMLFLTGVGVLVPGWSYAKRRAKSKATQESYPQRDDLEIQVAVKKKSDGVEHLGGSVKHLSLRGLSDEKFLRTRILRPNDKMHEAPATAPPPPPLSRVALTQTANDDVRVFQRPAANIQATEIAQQLMPTELNQRLKQNPKNGRPRFSTQTITFVTREYPGFCTQPGIRFIRLAYISSGTQPIVQRLE
jgi:hypothetical protein